MAAAAAKRAAKIQHAGMPRHGLVWLLLLTLLGRRCAAVQIPRWAVQVPRQVPGQAPAQAAAAEGAQPAGEWRRRPARLQRGDCQRRAAPLLSRLQTCQKVSQDLQFVSTVLDLLSRWSSQPCEGSDTLDGEAVDQ